MPMSFLLRHLPQPPSAGRRDANDQHGQALLSGVRALPSPSAFAEAAKQLDRARHSSLPLVVALLAIGAALRLNALTVQSLWTDEGFSIEYSTCDYVVSCITRITSGSASEQFDLLYYILLHTWRSVFGDSTAALRGLSVLFSVSTLPLVWSASNALFGRTVALWSVALSSTSAFAIFYAQETRPYAFLLFMAALQLALFATPRSDYPRGWRRNAFLLAALISSWSIFSLIFVVALAIGDLLARRAWRHAFAWWIPVAVVCLPAVFFQIMAISQISAEQLLSMRSDSPYENIPFVIYGHLVGQTYSAPMADLRGVDRWSKLAEHWPELSALVLVGVSLAYQAARAIRIARSTPGDRYGYRFIALSTAAFVAISLSLAAWVEQNWLPRHTFALNILAALLIPATTHLATRSSRDKWLSSVTLAALVTMNLWSLKNYYYDPAHWRDNYRSVALYLQEQRRLGRPAVMLVGRVSVLRYYGDDQTIDGAEFSRETLSDQIRSATDAASEVLIVVNREYSYESENGYVRVWEPRGLVLSMMSPAYEMIEKRAFHYFTIYRFRLSRRSGYQQTINQGAAAVVPSPAAAG
jgi:uncharacterized membrane protein